MIFTDPLRYLQFYSYPFILSKSCTDLLFEQKVIFFFIKNLLLLLLLLDSEDLYLYYLYYLFAY